MFPRSSLCFVLAACLCQQVISQWSDISSTSTSTQSSSTAFGSLDIQYPGSAPNESASNSSSSQNSTTTQSSQLGASNFGAQSNNNASASNSSSLDFANQAPVTQFFGQFMNHQAFGVKKCKKPKDCGLGLRCDVLLNLCVPFNAPMFSDIEKPCSNESECSRMHSCQSGLCRFCGPKSCRNNQDCCAGSFAEPGKPGKFYECLDIKDNEELSIAKQLGRVPANYQPIPKAAGGKSLDDAYEVESAELIQLGLKPAFGGAPKNPFYGKRCWARCNADNDCYSPRTPADIHQKIGCCDGVCMAKESCPRLSPQVIQHAQQLQQQRLQHQQALAQQQALQQQQSLLVGQAHQGHQQAAQWGAASHPQVVPQQAAVYYQPPIYQAPVTQKPVPHSWQEAQQQLVQNPAAGAAQPWYQG